MSTGYQVNLGSTHDYTVTRDKLIELAYRLIGVLPPGESLGPEELQEGIDRLNLIVREVDESGRWRWTIEAATHLQLQAGVGVYDANTGLPRNIAEIMSVVYRDANGHDSKPLKILKTEAYERIPDKMQNGIPEAVYLTDDINLPLRRLYVWPFPSSVATQSVVDGTDGNIYKCIYPHTATTTTRPITGANWRMAWQLSAGASVAWAANAQYTNGESLRMVIRRPVFDFDQADNTPDFPPQMYNLLVERLAIALGTSYRIPSSELQDLVGQMRGSFSDISASLHVKTNDIHNKVKYF